MFVINEKNKEFFPLRISKKVRITYKNKFTLFDKNEQKKVFPLVDYSSYKNKDLKGGVTFRISRKKNESCHIC